jgi:uncharacterized protein involved in outer membrane biogenesis
MNEAQDSPAAAEKHASRRRLPAGRSVLIGCAALVVGIVVCEWLWWPFLRMPVEAGLRHALKREVSIGDDFGVRFFGPLSLRTSRLSIAPAPGAPTLPGAAADAGTDFVGATQFKIKLPYSTLIELVRDKGENESKRLSIRTLEVDKLDATLVRDKDGHVNWRFGSNTHDTRPIAIPSFDRLVIGNGHIRLDDALAQLKFDAELHTIDVEHSSSSSETATRGLELTAKGSYRDRPLAIHLRSSGLIPLVESAASTPPVPIRAEARVGRAELDLDGKAGDLFKLGALSGKFRLKGPSLAAVGEPLGVTLPATAEFLMHGNVTKDHEQWTIAVDDLSLGDSRLAGNFHYDPTRDVPKLSGELRGARLSLPDLGPAFGAQPKNGNATAKSEAAGTPAPTATAAEQTPPRNGNARVLPQREFDLPSLARMDADVSVALDELDLGTRQLERLAPLKGHIVLERQTLTISDLLANTAKGKVQGSLSVNAQRDPPRWNADLRWSGVQLENFVKLRNSAERSAKSGYVSGTIAGRTKVRGDGSSTAQMLATLDGDAQIWIRNGGISHLLVEVAGIDVAEALGMLVKGDEKLPMQCAVAGLKIRRGQITPEVALIETSDSTLVVDGRVSLADERLKLVFRAHPKDKSLLTLRTPILIGGTFAHPSVSVDKTAIGARVAAAAALAAITPLAAFLALIDLGDPEKQACVDAMERVHRPPEPLPVRDEKRKRDANARR